MPRNSPRRWDPTHALKTSESWRFTEKVLDPQAAEELSPVSQLNTTVTVAVTEDSLLYRFRHEFTIKGKDEKGRRSHFP